MARIQPVLNKAETELVDQVAEVTQAKRTDVVKNAIAVYHWFVRHVMTGARIIARKPTGEEVELETPELSGLEAKGHRLSPEELRVLAKKLAVAVGGAYTARFAMCANASEPSPEL